MRKEIAISFLLAFAPLAARGAEVPTEPILRIETGMHTATIQRIATDPAGRFLVTGSRDKTVRVWDVATGEPLRTLRPPLGDGAEGIIFAVAISPDGRLVAASGMTGYEWTHKYSIYIFDRETGNLVERIGELPAAVMSLSFSPDGKKIAAALLNSKGLQLLRVSDGQKVAQDGAYGGNIFGLDWDQQSDRLVTSSDDGYIRLYRGDLRLLIKAKAHGGKEPSTVSFSPDGGKVAVGFHDSVSVEVLASDSLQSLYRPDATGTPNTNFQIVEWSTDGSLNATGLNPATGISLIRRWTDAGRGSFRDLTTGSFNTVAGLSRLPGGRLAFGTADPAWGIMDPTGEETLLVKSGVADFRDPGGLSVDATGSMVRFGYQIDEGGGAKSFATFSVRNHILILDTPKDPSLANPRTEAPTSSISGWKNSSSPPTLAGKPLGLLTYEHARSLAIAADGQSFLLGTSTRILSFDAKGKERWKSALNVEAWAVNFSGNDRLGVAASSDGTIRWFRADNGKEILALFLHSDRKRWVAWTPSGYYDASVGGEELVGWQINRGADQAADFFPASRFRDHYYRPDVISRVLDTLDEATALAQADAEMHRKTESMSLTQRLPPVVTVLAPTTETEVREAFVPFQVFVRSPSGEPITSVHALIDGRPAGSGRGLAFKPDPQTADPPSGQAYSLTVAVPTHDCKVSILAETRLSTSEPVSVKLRWIGVQTVTEKPVLYLLAVGVGTFSNPSFNSAYKLELPAKDARDVAASWKSQSGGLYSKVEVKTLTDEQATKDAILDGLEWLERQTTEKDVAILYFSGHGMNDPRSGEYLFVPYEGDLDARFKTLLPGREVRSALSTIPGKVLVFLDTCHSGNLLGTAKVRGVTDVTELLNELISAENGVVVFSASTGRQQAQERPEWKNGAFTSALLEALAGKADYRANGLYVTELESYLDRRVKELTRGLQTPVAAKPGGMPDFPVALMMTPK